MTERPAALLMLKEKVRKASIPGSINATAEFICGIIDHFNTLHWHDRNRYGEEIKELRKEVAELKGRISKLENKGIDE